MKDVGYYFSKIMSKITHNNEIMSDFYRRGGVKVGKGCLICSDISGVDSWLIEIGNNTTISTDVKFILHDFSAHLVFPGKSNLYGRITIGDNCFIGANSTVMYGIELGNNIIVAAGSVITKSFKEENIIIGGNPARVIGTWDAYRKKYSDKATKASMIKEQVKNGEDVLVKR